MMKYINFISFESFKFSLTIKESDKKYRIESESLQGISRRKETFQIC